MARKYYRIALGMHQHPETFAERGVKPYGGYGKEDKELLYPGDVVLVEEALILRPPTMGGWADPQKDGTWAIACAAPVQAKEEERVIRDEPSRISGINISERALRRVEREESEGESFVIPAPSARAASSPTVKRVRA